MGGWLPVPQCPLISARHEQMGAPCDPASGAERSTAQRSTQAQQILFGSRQSYASEPLHYDATLLYAMHSTAHNPSLSLSPTLLFPSNVLIAEACSLSPRAYLHFHFRGERSSPTNLSQWQSFSTPEKIIILFSGNHTTLPAMIAKRDVSE